MRWPSASLAACSCALVLAGCGGGGERVAPPPPPRIPSGLAQRLAAEADLVATAPAGSCAARAAAVRLQADAIAFIGRVPGRYQEQLMSAANGLVNRLSPCTAPTRREPPPGKGHDKHAKHEKQKHDEGNG
jgi:hypothetical protein